MSATVVLVHGAWHGAWCFDRVVPLLEAAGITSVAVDLPGHGADPGPFADLHGDAGHVRSVLDRVDGDAVLLGHSYGGAVITEAGDHPAVRHLAYLCAFPLDAGESCMAAAAEHGAEFSHAGRPDLVDAVEFHDDGTTTLTPDGATECLYSDCDAGTLAWALPRLGKQPMENLGQVPAAVAWHDRPSTYVVCEQDQGVHPGLQALMARRCSTTVSWPTSHSPFASRPSLLADLLVDLAG